MLQISQTQARQLFIHQQRLAGPTPVPTTANLLETVRALRCVQLDPLSVVARSHQLVLFSRVGPYELAALDQLLWQDRALFEYWAHCASIVLTEDYALHHARMRNYPSGEGVWSQRARQWMKDNAKLKRYILSQLKKRGPLLSRDLEEEGLHPKAWVSTGWTSGRNVSRMLDFLWLSGQIMVTARQGGQKVWDLAERVLPEWTPREKLSEQEITRHAIEYSLKALGVGTEKHIKFHFVRGRYPHFDEALAELIKNKRIRELEIAGWAGRWFIHADRLPLLDTLPTQHAIRTTLLSPFDNLIADRARTEEMFGFDFRIEIYVPKAKRQYGYYVLPLLHGDELIGRLDPEMNRETGVLTVNAVHAEPGAKNHSGVAVAQAVHSLAQFLGAQEIRYNRQRVPTFWKKALA
ncbi:MAG: YcaQ family DNA glycosylase [Anaerolineales bacterium]|nr:YcaQ family DNA glycosylase [Anaerolineales bacterium]